jgi:hypothetical protein
MPNTNTPSPWVVVLRRGDTTYAYPQNNRADAEQTASTMAEHEERAVQVGIYELRASAVVTTSVRFEGMGAPPPAGVGG